MSASGIKSVTVDKKEYVFSNLNDIVPRKIKQKYLKFMGISCDGISTADVTRIVKVDNSYFAFCKDKKVYYSDNTFYFMDTYTGIHGNVPSILRIYKSGMQEAYLITSSLYSKVYDMMDFSENNYRGGLFSAYYKGRIYIANLDSVYVFGKFNYDDKSTSLILEDNISTKPGDHSYSAGLFVINEKLYYMNETNIYILHYGDNDKLEEFKKMNIPPMIVNRNSVINIDNKFVCFLNNNRICVFDGETITIKKSMLDDMKVVTFNAFGSNATYYYINLTLDGVLYTYVYDILTGDEMLTDYYKLLCDQNGIAINVKNNAMLRLSVAYKTISDPNQTLSLNEDLGYCGKKIVTGYEIHVSGSGEIVISGDFGEKVFALKDGCNTARCNLGSVSYQIKFQNLTSDFAVKKAKFKYRTCGE